MCFLKSDLVFIMEPENEFQIGCCSSSDGGERVRFAVKGVACGAVAFARAARHLGGVVRLQVGAVQANEALLRRVMFSFSTTGRIFGPSGEKCPSGSCEDRTQTPPKNTRRGT